MTTKQAGLSPPGPGWTGWLAQRRYYLAGRLAGFVSTTSNGCLPYVIDAVGKSRLIKNAAGKGGLSNADAQRAVEDHWRDR